MNITTKNLRKLFYTKKTGVFSVTHKEKAIPIYEIYWDHTISFRRNKKILVDALAKLLFGGQQVYAFHELGEAAREQYAIKAYGKAIIDVLNS